jgi:PAS domain S-box-containing protein
LENHQQTSPQRLGRPRERRRRSVNHVNRLVVIALVSAAPAVAAALIFTWSSNLAIETRWILSTFILLSLWAGLMVLRQRAQFPLQTLSNLVSGLREGDYSARARHGGSTDALGELAAEINALASHLRGERLDSMEAGALLRAVMGEIDVAVFAFDPKERLILVNHAGERMLAQSAERLLGRSAEELRLSEFLQGETGQIVTRVFPGGGERWSARRGTYRQGGVQNQMLLLTDLSRALREEERAAWQRLLRVLGHELNNSLAPIKSIAGSMEDLLARNEKQDDWLDDARAGLSVISTRIASLTRFMQGYTSLARLPPPRLETVSLGPLIQRVIGLETRLPIHFCQGPQTTLLADADQLEQLLINLLRNSADAVLGTGASSERDSGEKISVSWRTANRTQVEILVADRGPGIANPANLFVPFFTTKQGGNGVGLVLSRQIAEGHGGTLVLENRSDGPGCVARLMLPLSRETRVGQAPSPVPPRATPGEKIAKLHHKR